jgi:hypothetical protein
VGQELRGTRRRIGMLPDCGALGLTILLLAGCSGFGRAMSSIGEAIARGAAATAIDASLPRTRAERTNYLETSTHADVIQFLDSLESLGLPVSTGTLGRSTEGREIPYAVVSRPLVRTPQEARR